MNIRVRARAMTVSEALRFHVEHRIAFALGRFERFVDRVEVLLQDVNGPRGGEDKVCRIEVRSPRGEFVAAEAVDSDPKRAIDHASARISRTVARLAARFKPKLGRSFAGE